MNVIYHLIGVAMAIIIIAKFEGEIETPEPVAAATESSVPYPDAQARPASWTPLSEDASMPEMIVARATFMGNPCPQSDCAEALAGYRWAEENAITEPARCEVLSGEFVTGCRLFARMEQQYNI